MATTKKKEQPQSTAHFKGPNVAFLDAEYLSARFKKGSIEDVISVGFVITDPAHIELERYYSTVQLTRGHKLTPLIIELTGLTDAELSKAPSYEDVMTDIIFLIKKYQVGKICVWGGDKSSFQRDLDGRTIEKGLKKDITKFINTFENIQKDVSLDITDGIDSGLSLADLKTICGLGGNVAHNALNDAEDMLECIRIIETDQMKYDGVAAGEYKKFRGEYVKNRSFSDDEEDASYKLSSDLGKQFLQELQDNGFGSSPKTKAFMDDLEFILGLGNQYMGTYAEMVAERESRKN